MQDRDNLLTRIETSDFIVAKRKDGIIHVYFKQGITLDIPLQEKLLQAYREITHERKMPFIFETAPNIRVTISALLNSKEIEKNSPVLLSVIFVNSFFQKILAYVYTCITSLNQPCKVVTNFQEGIVWLHKMKEKINQNQ
jgi:hypothetical protein